MRKFICVLLGHKASLKLQTTRGYTTYICARCGVVFAEKIKEKPKETVKKETEKSEEANV